jgi:hypothetical protein
MSKHEKFSKIKFLNEPVTTSWIASDGEVILFERKVSIKKLKNMNIDFIANAEIVDGPAYNVYRLYIDGSRVIQVAHTGFIIQSSTYDPSIESGEIIWGNNFENHISHVTIKITTQLLQTGTNASYSNVDNTIGNYKGFKGAFLRITLLKS